MYYQHRKRNIFQMDTYLEAGKVYKRDLAILAKCFVAQVVKAQLTIGEFISVNSIHDQAAWHGQAISIYFDYSQTSGQITILCWLFANRNINKQPFCHQNRILIMCWCCLYTEHNWNTFYCPYWIINALWHHLPNK